jgi:hypothetical protein
LHADKQATVEVAIMETGRDVACRCANPWQTARKNPPGSMH